MAARDGDAADRKAIGMTWAARAPGPPQLSLYRGWPHRRFRRGDDGDPAVLVRPEPGRCDDCGPRSRIRTRWGFTPPVCSPRANCSRLNSCRRSTRSPMPPIRAKAGNRPRRGWENPQEPLLATIRLVMLVAAARLCRTFAVVAPVLVPGAAGRKVDRDRPAAPHSRDGRWRC